MDRVLGPGAAARGWKVEELHNIPNKTSKSGYRTVPRYNYACPDRERVRHSIRGESLRDLLDFYKHWKPAREAVHMNSSSAPRVGGPEVIDAHRTRIRKSVNMPAPASIRFRELTSNRRAGRSRSGGRLRPPQKED